MAGKSGSGAGTSVTPGNGVADCEKTDHDMPEYETSPVKGMESFITGGAIDDFAREQERIARERSQGRREPVQSEKNQGRRKVIDIINKK